MFRKIVFLFQNHVKYKSAFKELCSHSVAKWVQLYPTLLLADRTLELKDNHQKVVDKMLKVKDST